MGKEQEDAVIEFLWLTAGEVDVDALVNRMTEGVVWQVNVPMARVVVGRADARAQIERHTQSSMGMLPGCEIRCVASNDREVFVERVEVAEAGGKRVSVHIVAVFEVEAGKIAAWREYFDSYDFAQQVGINPSLMYQD